MKILRLSASNVKRLVAVEIMPDGNLVVVGGENDQGKTSVLDSIAFALAGKDSICEQPLRAGERRGKVEVDVADDEGNHEFTVERTFTPGGGRLRVTPAEGAPMRAPQSFLDELIGRISFDPLSFSRMKPKRARAELAALIQLDTADLDEEHDRVFGARRDNTRERHRLEGALSEIERYDGAPSEEVKMSDLTDELSAADAQAVVVQEKENERARAEQRRSMATAQIARSSEELERLRRLIEAENDILARARTEEQQAQMEEHRLQGEVDGAKANVPDRSDIRVRIERAAETNRKVASNRRFAQISREISDLHDEELKQSRRIEEIAGEKTRRIADADYPIEGLGLDDEQVLFNGLPFDQASGAQKLRVSAAIGIAANPALKVLLVRDGSLLDKKSLAMLAEAAERADAQIWIERVGEDEMTSIVIEDGHVRL